MRNRKIDNIKVLLISLVVLGHLLELQLDYGINRLLYFIIYSFHMPMFVYVSGYFASFQWKRLLKKIVWPYILFQAAYILFANHILGSDLKMQWSKPYWILWYLFAMAIWLCTVPLISGMNKRTVQVILVIAIAAAIGVGYYNEIGREYSLSRTLVFYPFFLLGYYEKNHGEWDGKWIKTLCIGILCTAFLYVLFHYREMGIYWMYEAASYEKDGITPIYRMAHMLIAYSWIVVLKNAITGNCHSRIAQIGQNTMSIYLLHGFAIKWMDKYEMFQNIPFKSVAFIIVSVFLVFLFSTSGFTSFFQCLLFSKKGNQQKQGKAKKTN